MNRDEQHTQLVKFHINQFGQSYLTDQYIEFLLDLNDEEFQEEYEQCFGD